MFAYAIQDPGAWALRAYTNWIGEVKLTDNPPTCGGNYATAPGSNPLATYLDVNYVPAAGTWRSGSSGASPPVASSFAGSVAFVRSASLPSFRADEQASDAHAITTARDAPDRRDVVVELIG